MDKQELMAVLKETVRELVTQELEALLFLEREAFLQKTGDARTALIPAS